MANKQALQVEEQFEVVKALYEEAKLTLPPEERAQLAEIALEAPTALETESAADQPVVIRSRKPRQTANAEPIFTRISDLYEEAEAVRYLAEEENSKETSASWDEADSAPLADDDFAIPAQFGARDDEAQTDERLSSEKLAEEELALLAQGLTGDEDFDSAEVRISEDIEPAVALDDVLDGLLPPETHKTQETEETTSAEVEIATSAEAEFTTNAEALALSELDANRPEADDALKEQLADVKQAVEQAAATSAEAVPADQADELATYQADNQQDDIATLQPSPALARFIGETVRDVLDEELPQLVRGLVDETLGERQGRYGRTDTPHIGLRTKPSRH